MEKGWINPKLDRWKKFILENHDLILSLVRKEIFNLIKKKFKSMI